MPAARMTIPISSPPRLLLANCSSSITHPSRYLQLQRVAEKCANASATERRVLSELPLAILRMQDVVVLGVPFQPRGHVRALRNHAQIRAARVHHRVRDEPPR